MKRYDLQGVPLDVAAHAAFAYIADPTNLPAWTHAFAAVTGRRAVLRTPAGEVEVGLEVVAAPAHGTVDWILTFPDGSRATAFSRVVPLDERRCAYSFVLTVPPTQLEALEGVLEAQARTLAQELATLRGILNHG
jgi:hypothetical protein